MVLRVKIIPHSWFFLAAIGWGGFLFAHQAEAQSGYSVVNQNKISASVLADTADNQVGDFLIILNHQPQV